MSKTKVNFYCPTSTVELIDEMADKDHRDRTSMLNKMIDFYFQFNGHPALVDPVWPKPTTKKKAGAR